MSVEQATDYGPTLVAILFGIAFSCVFLALAMFLGPETRKRRKACALRVWLGTHWQPARALSVKFYQVALLFLIFDIEAAFCIPGRRFTVDCPAWVR